MPDNYKNLWVQENVNQVGKVQALEAIQNNGRALPCKVISVLGAIVQVAFAPLVTSPQTLPNIWIPVAESQWLRIPVQVGDLGVTMPADTFLGGVSGLGSGTADLTVNYGNLTTLVFMPVGNVNFPTMPDPNRAWVNGPNGFDATDTNQTGGIRYDAEAQTVTIFAGTNTIVLTADPSLISTITGTLGPLQTVVDGAGNTISQVVPAGGGVALGALFSALGSTRAAASQADLDSLINDPTGGVIAKTLQNLCVGLGTAAASTLTGGTAFNALISAAGFVTGLAGIKPTIPDCSSIVRLSE